MSQPAFFHEASESVRFWVLIDGNMVGARISRQTLHYQYCAHAHGESHLDTYHAHSGDIDAAVRRRVARGSIEPVIVREFDLNSPPAQETASLE